MVGNSLWFSLEGFEGYRATGGAKPEDVGEQALIAAGAVLLEGTQVPPKTLWAGCPAKQIKELTDEQLARIAHAWKHYVNNGQLSLARYGRRHIDELLASAQRP